VKDIVTPVLVINFKNYEEVYDAGVVELAKAAQQVHKKFDISVVVCPPNPCLAEVSKQVSIPVFAQHVDLAKPGSSTGAIVPEVVKSIGVRGSLINHSERRLWASEGIKYRIDRLQSIGLISLACAQTPEEVSEIAKFGPDWLAVEPPELIGSGKAVSKVKPQIVTNSIVACRKANPDVKLLCGAGIVTGEDVEAAVKLGAKGVLVASGIVKAKNWIKIIEELTSPLA
jgi:triosephosphate isomerase